jgi:hypothetical protein
MTNDLLLQTMTLTKYRPVLSSERRPTKNKTVTVTLRLTDRHSQCDFDLVKSDEYLVKVLRPPCGGGVEYLQRDPASRRRRRR